MCDAIAKSLHGAGYEVDVCYDGDEALRMILEEKYDLLVLDLNLPGTDGMEILRTLRQEMRKPRFSFCLQEARLRIRWRGLTQELMTIWRNRSICRS